MGKHKIIRFRHNGHLNVIRGKVLPGSAADYLMLLRRIAPMTDEYVIERYKNGEQLVFNTKFIQSIKERYNELHCEFCGKDLVLYYWWETNKRGDMATADHFFPKSLDKERLSFEKRKAIIKAILGDPKVTEERKFPTAGSISEVASKFEEQKTKKAKRLLLSIKLALKRSVLQRFKRRLIVTQHKLLEYRGNE